MHKDRQQAVITQFDRDSDKYLSRNVRPETNREHLRLLELIGTDRFKNALDLGCGPGTLSQQLVEICDDVWCIDTSERMIDTASARFRHTRFKDQLHFEVGRAEHLRFPDEHFDLVVCVGVLRYLDSWEKGLQEIHRVLKPNGVLVVTFYYRFSIQWLYMCLLGRPLLPIVQLLKGRPLRECLLTYKAEPLPFSYLQFKRAFYALGFAKLHCQHSGFEVYPLRRLFPRLSRYVYLKLEEQLFKSRAFGWLGSICIVKGTKIGGGVSNSNSQLLKTSQTLRATCQET